MNGSVIIFTFPETNNAIINIKKFLRGEQYGEYFGAALTSCNLNGDAEDELIVGAPLWSKNIDEGRIYVYTALSNVCCMLYSKYIILKYNVYIKFEH